MHCGKDSERFAWITMGAKKWSSQMMAGLPDGNFTGSSWNLQVERWESVIIGRRNSIFQAKGIMFLESINWPCPGYLKVLSIQNS